MLFISSLVDVGRGVLDTDGDGDGDDDDDAVVCVDDDDKSLLFISDDRDDVDSL